MQPNGYDSLGIVWLFIVQVDPKKQMQHYIGEWHMLLPSEAKPSCTCSIPGHPLAYPILISTKYRIIGLYIRHIQGAYYIGGYTN